MNNQENKQHINFFAAMLILSVGLSVMHIKIKKQNNPNRQGKRYLSQQTTEGKENNDDG